MRLSFLAIPLLLCIGGCFPSVSVSQPAFTGRVVDDEGRGVPQANLEVRAAWDGTVISHSHTDDKGNFAQPAMDKHWFVYFLPQDNPPPPKFWLTATSREKMTRPLEFEGGQVKALGLGADKVVEVGSLQLK